MNKKIKILIISEICLVVLFCAFAFSQERSEQRQKNNEQKQDERLSFIRKVNFFTREGEFVSGKLIFEDDKKIAVEIARDNKFETKTFNKVNIDTRTLRYNNMPEYQYLMDMAEYFISNTWDFKDDPDDFINAIRLLEKAERQLSESRPDSRMLKEVKDKIENIRADRETWIEEMKSRAELKKLEERAMVDRRLRELLDEVKAMRKDVNDLRSDMNRQIGNLEIVDEKLADEIERLRGNVDEELDNFNNRIEANRSNIFRLERDFDYYNPYQYRYRRPRYYYRPDKD